MTMTWQLLEHPMPVVRTGHTEDRRVFYSVRCTVTRGVFEKREILLFIELDSDRVPIGMRVLDERSLQLQRRTLPIPMHHHKIQHLKKLIEAFFEASSIAMLPLPTFSAA